MSLECLIALTRSLESDTTERLHFHFTLSFIGEGNGNPLQCSCLENHRDGEAWWAAVYGIAQSWTRLKRLSSSSRTFSTVLNRSGSGKSGHPYLVPDLRRKLFSFSLFSMMLVVCLLYMASLCWGDSLLLLVYWQVYHENVFNFIKMFFCIYWDNYVIFILHLVNVVYHINWFSYGEPFFNSSLLIMV